MNINLSRNEKSDLACTHMGVWLQCRPCPICINKRLIWCNSHGRRASRCLAGESGILLPCKLVDLTDEVEIVENEPKPIEEDSK